MSSILTGGSTIPEGSHPLLTAILTAIRFWRSNIVTTAGYQHVSLEMMRDALARSGKLLALGEEPPAIEA